MATRLELVQAHQRGVAAAFLAGIAFRGQQPAVTPPVTGTTPVGPGLSEAEVIQGIQQGITTGLQTLNAPITNLRQALNQGLAEVGRHVDHLGEQIENAAFGGDDQAAPILRELREGQTQINAQVTAANQGVQNLTTQVGDLVNQVAGLTSRVVSLEGRRDARHTTQSNLAQRLRREGIPYDRAHMGRLAAEIENRTATEDEIVARLRAAAPPPAPAPVPAPVPAPTPAPTPAPAPPAPVARRPRVIPAPVRTATNPEARDKVTRIFSVATHSLTDDQHRGVHEQLEDVFNTAVQQLETIDPGTPEETNLLGALEQSVRAVISANEGG
jgi:hypothetical protein